MPELLQPLVDRMVDLQKTADGAPGFTWGTVTQTSPLRVIVDGADEELPVTPNNAPAILVPGERVILLLVGTRLTVLTVANRVAGLRGTLEQLNQIEADGLVVDGCAFYCTTNGAEYRGVAGAWWKEPTWQKGFVSYTSSIAAGGTGSTAVTFDPEFTEIPVLGALSIVSTGTAFSMYPRGLSETGFTIQLRNVAASGNSTPTGIYWSAYGPTV